MNIHTHQSVARAAAVFLLCGVLFTVASCGSEERTSIDGYYTAESDGKDYQFLYPEAWEVLREDGMYAIGAPDGKANITVTCFDEADFPTDDVLDYAANSEYGYLAGLTAQYGDRLEVLTPPTETTVGGVRSARMRYHQKIGDDEYCFETVLAIVPGLKSTYLYCLTYTAGEDPDGENGEALSAEAVFDEHLPVFERVLETFTFR